MSEQVKMTEEELIQRIAEAIEQVANVALPGDQIKALLLEVQREQLKGLVYRAFMHVTQGTPEAQAEEAQAAESAPGEQSH